MNGNGGGDSAAAAAAIDPHNGNPQETTVDSAANGSVDVANGNGGVAQQPQSLDLSGAGTAGGSGVGGGMAAAAGGDAASMAGDDAGTDAGASSIPPSEAGGRPPLDTVGSEGGGPSSMGGMVGPPSPLTGCYLLIILGEPHSEEHKDNILQHLLKGKSRENID